MKLFWFPVYSKTLSIFERCERMTRRRFREFMACTLAAALVTVAIPPRTANAGKDHLERMLKYQTGLSGGRWAYDNVLLLYANRLGRSISPNIVDLHLGSMCLEVISDDIAYPVTIYWVDGRSIDDEKGKWIELAHAHCNVKPLD